MLGKLMKYELRAMGRIMLPGFAAVLVLAGLTRLSTEFLTGKGSWQNLIAVTISMLFGLSCFAICLMTILLMIQRFRNNLLRDEGYLMHTLPVTTGQNIFAKVLSVMIWNFGTAVTCVLSFTILVANASAFKEIKAFSEQIVHVPSDIAANGALYMLEFILLITVSFSAFALLVYASMALGHRFQSNRGLMSVLIFIGFQIINNIIMTYGGYIVDDVYGAFNISRLSDAAEVHVVLLLMILLSVIYCLIFYAITAVNLKKHLNLE